MDILQLFPADGDGLSPARPARDDGTRRARRTTCWNAARSARALAARREPRRFRRGDRGRSLGSEATSQRLQAGPGLYLTAPQVARSRVDRNAFARLPPACHDRTTPPPAIREVDRAGPIGARCRRAPGPARASTAPMP